MANTDTRIAETSHAAIAGLFRDERQGERTLDDLRASGFSDNEVGVATPEDGKETGFWTKVSKTLGKHGNTERESDLEESLRDSGIPEQQANYFSSKLPQGGVLITIHAGPERAAKALSILQRNGADVGSLAGEWKRPAATTAGTTQAGMQHIRLMGEILRVHKERVPRGEVRLRKEIVTEQQNIEVPVSREELVVERTQTKGQEAATGEQVGAGQKEIRIPLTEEQVRVEKKPVMNEDIAVGKREVQDTKRISDQVRHEEIRTEGDVKEEVKKGTEKPRRAA